MCFWKFEWQPQKGRLFIILSDFIGFSKRSLLPPFKMLSFLDCLVVCLFLLHRIYPHVVLVFNGVEHQVDVVMAIFNPTPDKIRAEFFSAVQIYDSTIYCKSALEFVTKRGKNTSLRTLETRGTQGHQKLQLKVFTEVSILSRRQLLLKIKFPVVQRIFVFFVFPLKVFTEVSTIKNCHKCEVAIPRIYNVGNIFNEKNI